MTSLCPALRVVPSVLALVCLLVPTTSAQGRKLNGPLARPFGGDIQDYVASPGGERIVYLADEETDEVFELFVAKADGGSRVKLVGPAVEGGSVSWFSLGARGRRVVLTGDLEVDGVLALYSIPIGGGALVELAGPDLGPIGSVQIDPTERFVVYQAGAALFSVPITGGAPVRLDGGEFLHRFFLSPDGQRVVFVASPSFPRIPELFTVPITGGTAVRLNLTGTELSSSGAQDPGVRIDALNASVVFTAKPIGGSTQTWRLYTAPLDGSGLAQRLLRRRVVESLVRLGSQGDRVVCVASSPSGSDLVSTSIDGSGGVVTLFSLTGQTVRKLEITPDGRFVLFVAGQLSEMALYRVPIEGSSSAVQIAETDDFVISPDSSRVVYNVVNGPSDVATFSARVDLSSPPLRIADGIGHAFITPDSTRVVFELPTPSPASGIELHSVPILGGASPVRLNGPLPLGGTVQGDPAFAGDRVVYRASEAAPNQFELFSALLDGSQASVRLNQGFPIGPVEGDVWAMALSPDGTRVVYRADQETDNVVELFSVRTDKSEPPVQLSIELEAGESVSNFAITPDGERVVYWIADAFSPSRLMIVPIEGGASALLGEHLSGSGLFDATGTHIVVVQAVPGGLPDRRILSLALDGSSVVELASGPERGTPALLTPDGRLLFHTIAGLSIRPIDGSATALQLVSYPSFGGIDRLVLDPSNTRIVYTGDLLVDQRYELFSTRIDGSTSAVRLSPTLPTARQLTFQSASDGWVYFQAPLGGGTNQLYRVPIDGATPAVRLNAPLAPGGEVSGFVVSVPAGRVAYLADQEAFFRYEIFSVPLAGGASSKLSNGLYLGARSDSFRRPMLGLSPDGGRIVFRADGKSLYGVPIDGDSAPTLLSAPLATERLIGDFHFGPDGASVLYSADVGLTAFMGYALFHAPIDTADRAHQVTGVGYGLPNRGVAPQFSFTPDNSIVFQSDQQTRGVTEVFINSLKKKLTSASLR